MSVPLTHYFIESVDEMRRNLSLVKIVLNFKRQEF